MLSEELVGDAYSAAGTASVVMTVSRFGRCLERLQSSSEVRGQTGGVPKIIKLVVQRNPLFLLLFVNETYPLPCYESY